MCDPSVLTMKLHETTLSVMKSVGLRELKNRLSEVIREVRGGEEVLVTDRGQAIAELRSLEPAKDLAVPAHLALQRLAHLGQVRLGAPNASSLYSRQEPVQVPGTAARLLDEERRESWEP